MIKTLLVGIWAVAIMAGSTWFFSGAMSSDPGEAEKPSAAYFGGLDYVKLEPVVVPSVRENAIHGYFVLEAVFTMKEAKKAELSVPIEYLLKDVLTDSIYGNRAIDAFKLDKFDKKAFQEKLLADINTKFGEKVVYEVLIQKFDFIKKDEIRDMQIRRS